MILKRFYDEPLAQASYLVGCAETGEALVVDPNRDVAQYLDAAAREKLNVTQVTETHIHADFVSGLHELAARTGAKPLLSAEGGPDWSYGFAAMDGAVLLHDGDSFNVGNIRVEVLHTPGHTPEHLCFVITDTASADSPMGMFTGDFLFVGDVGRPDLLETAAGIAGAMDAGARQLFASLGRLADLPDYMQIWPGHGAGSACGRSLGAVPQTTLGYERRFNAAFDARDEDAFVRAILAGQPEPPAYFARMKRMNRDGPPIIGELGRPQRLPDTELAQRLGNGWPVIDTRTASEYAAGHVPGTLSIPLNRSFTGWAGWLVPYDVEFCLIVDDARCPACPEQAAHDLRMIGLDHLAGYFGASAIAAWGGRGVPLETIDQMTVDTLRDRLSDGSATVIDVRGRSEWEAGHIPGAVNIPVGHLATRLIEVPLDRSVVVHCQSGGRSSIAASVLRHHGYTDIANLRGGIQQWRRSGYPIEDGAGGG